MFNISCTFYVVPENYKHPGDKRLFFFTPRLRKYPNGSRPSRAAGGGTWKASGSKKEICHGNDVVGWKRTLVYYKGNLKAKNKTDGIKTDWSMHEFISGLSSSWRGKPKPLDSAMKLDDWVLCRLQKSRGTKNKSNGPVTISRAQSGMSNKQAANTAQSPRITIDPNGGYSGDIMAPPIAAVDASFSHAIVACPSLVAVPGEQMVDINGMLQQLTVPSGESMAYFDGTVLQTLAQAPSEPMIDFDCQPITDFNCMAPTLARAPGATMSDFDGTMAQPFLRPSNELTTSFIKMAQPFLVAQSELDHVAQTSAMEPREPMTNFNGMAQPFGEPMMCVNGTTLLPPQAVSGQRIVDFNATLQPSTSVLPLVELNRTTRIYNNHSTGQDFQQNSGNAMDQYGMGHGELEQPPSLHHYQQEMRIRLPPLMPDHQQEIGMKLPTLIHDHQQGMKTKLPTLIHDHQQGMKMKLPSLMNDHQQVMETELPQLIHDHQQGMEMELPPFMHDHQQGMEMKLPPSMNDHQTDMELSLLMHNYQQGMEMELPPLHDYGIEMELPPLMDDYQQGMKMKLPSLPDYQQGMEMNLPSLMHDHQQGMEMEVSSLHDHQQGMKMDLPPLMNDHQQRMKMKLYLH